MVADRNLEPSTASTTERIAAIRGPACSLPIREGQASGMLLLLGTEIGNLCTSRKSTALLNRVVRARLPLPVRRVEPLLKKVNPQHDPQSYRLAAIARLGIMRLHKCLQFAPRNDGFHCLKKLLPLALPAVLLETALRHHRPILNRSGVLVRYNPGHGSDFLGIAMHS